MLTRRRCQIRMDPLQTLPESLVATEILPLLQAHELVKAASLNRRWRSVCEDEQLWRPLCAGLWAGKLCNPTGDLAVSGKLSWREAYVRSLEDAKRTQISREELCRMEWTFNFKHTAGEYWVALDPFYHGSPKMRRFFNPDGSTYSPPDDPFAGYECRWRFTKSQHGRRGTFVKINHFPSLELSRTSSWGWSMQNIWVTYQSVGQRKDDKC